MSREETLPPNYEKLDVALRSIGYSFEVAVADIVDNSIDAGAKNIAIRLLTNTDGRLGLAVWDNGRGMNERTLKEAMRFGADLTDDLDRLGKFGLGLKLASLSQAREVSVVSSDGGVASGRAWLEHGIRKGFSTTVFDRAECKTLVDKAFPDRNMRPSGTVVLWTHLYRIGHQAGSAAERAQKLSKRLKDYLGLAFHRFLSGKARRISLTIDIAELGSGAAGIPIRIQGLDPFGYRTTGRAGFPAQLALNSTFKNHCKVVAHIWPSNSDDAEYKLPGGSNGRQGFYFYRNNRLIQGGGWNGIREVDPHLSLARVEVDVTPTFDMELSLDVKKVEIQLPPDLALALQNAKTSENIDFKRYLSLADLAYRKRTLTESELPLVPASGLPSELIAYFRQEMQGSASTKRRELDITWAVLPSDLFFEIDRDNAELRLNKEFRRRLLHGLPGSSADLPVVKALLFFVLRDVLVTERLSAPKRERVEQLNRLLLKAVKYEREDR